MVILRKFHVSVKNFILLGLLSDFLQVFNVRLQLQHTNLSGNNHVLYYKF